MSERVLASDLRGRVIEALLAGQLAWRDMQPGELASDLAKLTYDEMIALPSIEDCIADALLNPLSGLVVVLAVEEASHG